MAVSNYVAGILVALLTTFLSAFGLAMQKRVHSRLARRREHATLAGDQAKLNALRSYKQPLWLVGITCMILSSLLSLVTFALLGQAVASSMAVSEQWQLSRRGRGLSVRSNDAAAARCGQTSLASNR